MVSELNWYFGMYCGFRTTCLLSQRSFLILVITVCRHRSTLPSPESENPSHSATHQIVSQLSYTFHLQLPRCDCQVKTRSKSELGASTLLLKIRKSVTSTEIPWTHDPQHYQSQIRFWPKLILSYEEFLGKSCVSLCRYPCKPDRLTCEAPVVGLRFIFWVHYFKPPSVGSSRFSISGKTHQIWVFVLFKENLTRCVTRVITHHKVHNSVRVGLQVNTAFGYLLADSFLWGDFLWLVFQASRKID